MKAWNSCFINKPFYASAVDKGGDTMFKKGKIGYLFMLMLLLSLLAGCGASSSDKMMTTTEAAEEAMYSYSEDIYPSEMVMEEAAAVEEAGSGSESIEVKETERKLIRNVNMDVETENFDELMKSVSVKTQALGGYIENSRIYNGSSYYDERRNADLTLRIPSENLDNFLSAVSETCNVISQNESVEDVTLQYVDLKSHKDALLTEQDRLLELLEQAETVEDIITIESRLSEVRYQLESMESQLRTLDNQVSYSTVYLYIQEVKRYTPVKERTVWEKISDGFVESLIDVGEGIGNFFINLIINIPYLVVWAVVIIVLILIIKWLRNFTKKRRQKKADKKEKAVAEVQTKKPVEPTNCNEK